MQILPADLFSIMLGLRAMVFNQSHLLSWYTSQKTTGVYKQALAFFTACPAVTDTALASYLYVSLVCFLNKWKGCIQGTSASGRFKVSRL
jgi:hypothetical protein